MTRAVAAIAAVILVLVWHPLWGQIPPYGGEQAYAADLAARRAAVMEALGPDAVLVLWSAPARVYSTDTNYEYRQESNLLYLTGIEQDGIVDPQHHRAPVADQIDPFVDLEPLLLGDQPLVDPHVEIVLDGSEFDHARLGDIGSSPASHDAEGVAQ